MNGWKLGRTFSMVNWCGHGQEYQPWLQPDGWWLPVPILGGGDEQTYLKRSTDMRI
jgi:hypothetical protein